MRLLGVTKKDFPTIRAIQLHNTDKNFFKYKPENSEINFKTLNDFLNKLKDNKIEHYFKSEKLPSY